MENMNAGDLANLAVVILFCGMLGTIALFAIMGTRALIGRTV
jgi:hypothetical protein